MGNFYHKDFVRNEEIEGQGKIVLHNAKIFGLRNEELSDLYTAYYRFPIAPNGTINVNHFIALAKLSFTPLSNIIFQYMDPNKNNRLPYNEWMVLVWNICTLKERDMVNYLWSMFDTNNHLVMEAEEVRMMFDFIWGFKQDRGRKEVLKQLDLTFDKKVTRAELMVLYNHFKSIFKPIFDIQHTLQHSICTPFFWKRLTKRRYKMFHPGRKKNDGLHYKSVFEIIDDYPMKTQLMLVCANLHYFYRMEGVPLRRYKDWYHVMQSCKQPLNLLLPPEVYEPDPQAIAKAEVEALAKEEKTAKGPKHGMHATSLLTKVNKGKGVANKEDALAGIDPDAYMTDEEKDRLRRLSGTRRKFIDRIAISIADFQREILERYYPEKPVVFPLHPYPPPSDKRPLFEPEWHLQKVHDGENEIIDALRNPHQEDQYLAEGGGDGVLDDEDLYEL